MPVQALEIRLDAFRHDVGRAVTHDEFLAPLAIHHGEVEEAVVIGEPYRSGKVRFWSARCSGEPVSDAEFDGWAAAGFRVAVEFLERRPPDVFATIQETGLKLQVCVEVWEAGEPSAIDWPDELYAVCRRLGLGLGSMWSPPDEV